MINREKLLEIASSKHAREIYRFIKESEVSTYYNDLCRKLEFPKPTINRHLKIMEECGILRGEWKRMTISEKYLMKGLDSKVHRERKVWVRAIDIPKTDEAKAFDSLIYGTLINI